MLKGKTAIITGSGRGIGKAIALKLASYGANIVITIFRHRTMQMKHARKSRLLVLTVSL